MADLRLWSREMITDFIELYKTHPCLWDVKCVEYKNKHTKSLAYKDLVKFCKKRGFPEANRHFVSRKLQSLRGSFRKELRKLEKFKRSGQAYVTNLWYFNNLMFTIENNADDDNVNEQSGDDEQLVDMDDEDDKFIVDEDKFAQEEHSVTSSPLPTQTKKRKRSDNSCLQPEFFDIGQETTSQPRNQLKDLSEFELTGLSIAKKLARMDDTQAIYAESLINTVIRKGLLNKLKEDTDLCDSLCAKRMVGVNLPPQSNSGCSNHMR